MSLSSLSSLLAAGVAAAAPLALTGLGGLFTEAAGSLSVALEGAMLGGAFFFVFGANSGGLFWGLALALLSGLLIGALVGLSAERLKSDVFVAGLAANMLVPGGISMLSQALYKTKGVVGLSGASGGAGNQITGRFEDLAETARSLPLLGPAVFGQHGLFYLLVAASGALWLIYTASPFGLRVRAAGEPGEAIRAAGLDRDGLRIGAHLVAGAASALAGAALAYQISAFVPGMSAGRGWIALVAIYLGGKRPAGLLAASLGFGLLLALSNAAQALQNAPAELILALPYLFTAAALMVGRAAKRRRA